MISANVYVQIFRLKDAYCLLSLRNKIRTWYYSNTKDNKVINC